MRFDRPLVPARLIRRYKRFLADVVFEEGGEATAHCPNPGAMLGLATPGARVWLSSATNPARKLRWTWELVEPADGIGQGLVGINTGHPNRLAAEAISAGWIPELSGYGGLRREVKYGRNSRIDLLLEEAGLPPCYVEVKNVHLLRGGGLAEFPDCVTTRGAKHLEELGDMVEAGHRAVMLYVVQRVDCTAFAIAGDLDPGYARALTRALARGVEAYCVACEISPREILVGQALPVRF
ncbi:DNA/RNA nuclease SfsA [Algihabitans albus]|uniref:DNA/RNA nuclease SfsA n=1 Tax=Algihabitans albus TaxID=2164067 RepID=UPI000E5D8554|nr:DNA/RNA nuclease SfsA [Algihabitans albus]